MAYSLFVSCLPAGNIASVCVPEQEHASQEKDAKSGVGYLWLVNSRRMIVPGIRAAARSLVVAVNQTMDSYVIGWTRHQQGYLFWFRSWTGGQSRQGGHRRKSDDTGNKGVQ